MTTTGKIALGMGIASSALLAAWLLTGTRKEKTKVLVAKGAQSLKGSLKTAKETTTATADEVAYYV